MKILIEKLTEKTLQEAETLRDKVFGKSKKDENLTLKASLYPTEYEFIYKENFIKELEYWVAIIDNKVVGIIGLYSEIENNDDSCWLGWFAVEPKFRGKRIGEKLLNFAIDKAKERWYNYLKLYSYNSKNYQNAIKLYKQNGFETYKEENKTLYFKLDLNESIYYNKKFLKFFTKKEINDIIENSSVIADTQIIITTEDYFFELFIDKNDNVKIFCMNDETSEENYLAKKEFLKLYKKSKITDIDVIEV